LIVFTITPFSINRYDEAASADRVVGLSHHISR
jgi:hypothetical protein